MGRPQGPARAGRASEDSAASSPRLNEHGMSAPRAAGVTPAKIVVSSLRYRPSGSRSREGSTTRTRRAFEKARTASVRHATPCAGSFGAGSTTAFIPCAAIRLRSASASRSSRHGLNTMLGALNLTALRDRLTLARAPYHANAMRA